MANGPGDPPRVSVIVRTRDRPRLLAEALESLRAQTFPDFETIVVNDGAPLPEALFQPAPGRGLRVVVPAPPGGRARALNAGISAARGRYVAYLDDDDLYRPAHLETLARFLDGSDEYGAAFTAADQVSQRLRPDGGYEAGERRITYGRPFDPHRLLYKNDIPLIALMHRRDLVGKAGPFDESFDLFEDWDFLIRLSRVTRVRFLSETTAVYRLRDDGTNATTASAWHGARAEAARKALFVKHAALRGPEAEMALVDGFEEEWWRHEAELNELRARLGSAEGARSAAEAQSARLEDDLRALRADAARQLQAAGERESALGAERDALAAERDVLAAERDAFALDIDAVHRSLWWRLATPWWRLKQRLRK